MENKTFTEGPILKPLLKFALPVVLALVLQSLYGAVDLFVVGQFASSADASAVSTGSQIMQTLTGVMAGLAMGTTILLGQQLGGHHDRDAGKTVGASIALFGLLGILCSILIYFNASSISSLMNAPTQAFDQTVAYVATCGAGMIFITAYNLLGSLFRGIGNSKIPLMSVAIAAIINVFGDLLFVCVFHLGSFGAALATVLSQAISVIFSCIIISKISLPFSFEKKDIRFDGHLIQRIIGFGFPLALADLLVGLSFLVILAIVNVLGVEASAGVGVAEKVCAFIMLVPSAFSQSMAAIVAQNYGANKLDRANTALRYGMLVSFIAGVIMSYLSFFHGNRLSQIFSSDPEVVMRSWQYLRAYAIDCLLTPLFFCMAGYFNGCGKTKFVMCENLIGALCIRIPVSYFMSLIKPASLFLIGLATPCSSLVQTLLCLSYLLFLKKKRSSAKTTS